MRIAVTLALAARPKGPGWITRTLRAAGGDVIVLALTAMKPRLKRKPDGAAEVR